MSLKNNSNEKEYLHVKRSLEVLGYKDPLGIDSVSVVNKVLNDLIKTTEAFKKLQDERNSLKEQMKSQNEIVLPLRNENIKLTKENNDLHNEIIRLKDNLDNKNENSSEIKKFEDENKDLKFLNNQKDIKIKNLNIEVENMKRKLNDFIMNNNNNNKFESNMKFENISNENNNIIDDFKQELSTFNLNKEDWANDLRLNEKNLEKLRNEIRNLKNNN